MKYLKFGIIWKGFTGASAFAQFILITLFIFSVLSWAIAFNKFFRFIILKKRTKKFLSEFSNTPFKEFAEKDLSAYSNIPLVELLKEGKKEFFFQEGNPREQIQESKKENILLNVLDTMKKISRREIEKLEKYLGFLATITGVSPFLGLLGTVWGIMEAFLEIRKSGSAHISVLAPGIADALITTIAGLLVAIPALIFFNYFTGELKKYENLSQEFIDEVKIKMRKAFFLS